MRLLTHHHLDTDRVRAQFAKLQQAVARDDFKSPNLKKLSPMPYRRFKLDQTHRLLVQFARHGDKTVCLALEVIHNHDYANSRFLRGASLNWDQLDLDDASAPGADDLNAQAPALRYVHPHRSEIHVLDKVLSFDNAQQAVYDTPAPLILVGSAGYRAWLQGAGLFAVNLVAQDWLAKARPTYDFMVVDEVQDLTSVQLALLLKTLAKPGQFLLCGDSNQIVHPNFFSWAAVNTLFWHDESLARLQTISVLSANFRNAQAVTQLANRLLKIKHARFGSIDREPNFLVQATAQSSGSVQLLLDKDSTRRELNAKTRDSTQFAVLMSRDENRAAERAQCQTPLVFSVHEAKGLEYANVIWVDMVSGQRHAGLQPCPRQDRPFAGAVQVLRQRAVWGADARRGPVPAGRKRHRESAAASAGLAHQ